MKIGGVEKQNKRTFCSMLRIKTLQRYFESIVNKKTTDETVTYISIFTPKVNSEYYGMSERAKKLIMR